MYGSEGILDPVKLRLTKHRACTCDDLQIFQGGNTHLLEVCLFEKVEVMGAGAKMGYSFLHQELGKP